MAVAAKRRKRRQGNNFLSLLCIFAAMLFFDLGFFGENRRLKFPANRVGFLKSAC